MGYPKTVINKKCGSSECIEPGTYCKDIQTRYNALYNSSFCCIYIHDLEGRVLDANDAALDLLGYSREELGDLNFDFFFPKEQIKSTFRFIELVSNSSIKKNPFELRLRKKNMEFIWVEAEASILHKNGAPYAIQWIARDITQKKNMIDELHALSLIDDLTGLYNRRGFINLAEQHLRLAKRLKKEMMVLFADVDNLKIINDKFGHKEGDKVLIETANILKNTFRESDIIARIGGDEFVVLTIDTSYGTAETVSKRLQDNIRAYNKTKTHPYNLSISKGITTYNAKAVCSVYELLEEADKLMYHHKRIRQHCLPVFDPDSRTGKRLMSGALT